jgi:hypothetical protein
MNKQITVIFILFFLTLLSCRQENIRLIGKSENRYAYQDRFKISLPNGYFFDSSIIYDSDSSKVGEVVFAYDKLLSPNTLEEILKVLNEGGSFETIDYSYSADCFDCEFIKSGKIKIKENEWIYHIDKSTYEGENDFGYWNSFTFVNIDDSYLLLITFYNKNLEQLEIEPFVKILETIEKK